MRYFDYQSVARESGISAEDLERLRDLIRQEFPGDDMLFELHVMRACTIIKNGPYTMEQIVADLAPAPAPGIQRLHGIRRWIEPDVP